MTVFILLDTHMTLFSNHKNMTVLLFRFEPKWDVKYKISLPII